MAISWDDNATPINFEFDPNNIPPPPQLRRQVNDPDANTNTDFADNADRTGWVWQPDSNGLLFSHYFDHDGLECMVYETNPDGTFYWSCNDVGYSCQPIADGYAGVFWRGIYVGTMALDETLHVNWDPDFNPVFDIDIDSDEDDPDP